MPAPISERAQVEVEELTRLADRFRAGEKVSVDEHELAMRRALDVLVELQTHRFSRAPEGPVLIDRLRDEMTALHELVRSTQARAPWSEYGFVLPTREREGRDPT
jgi:hypothetical protein